MRFATVFTNDSDYSHFIEIARSLPYVKRIETDEETKGHIINNVMAGLEEVRMFQKGTLITTTAKDFLNERRMIFPIKKYRS